MGVRLTRIWAVTLYAIKQLSYHYVFFVMENKLSLSLSQSQLGEPPGIGTWQAVPPA